MQKKAHKNNSKPESLQKKEIGKRRNNFPQQMTINLADMGCEVADEDVSSEISSVNRKVVPRTNLTANI